MDFSPIKDSFLKLNSEELKFDEIRRRKIKYTYLNPTKYKEELPTKDFKKSVTKYHRKKTRTIENNKIFKKKEAPRKKMRHITLNIKSNKKINLKQKSFSNKVIHVYPKNFRKSAKNLIDDINPLKKEEEKPNLNLKKVENEIFAKINNMKYNFQNNEE